MKHPPPLPRVRLSPPPLPAPARPRVVRVRRLPTQVASAPSEGREEGSVAAVMTDPTPSTGAMVVDEKALRELAPESSAARPPPMPSRSLTAMAIVAMGLAVATTVALRRLSLPAHADDTHAAAARYECTSPVTDAALAKATPPVETPAAPPARVSSDAIFVRSTEPDPRMGTLRVTVGGDHRVYVDGREIGHGPGNYPVMAGKHEVQVGSLGTPRSVDVPRQGEVVLDSMGWNPLSIPDVDCAWSPYQGAWGCGLAQSFEQGRFGVPPVFLHDAGSISAREKAWSAAKAAPGARAVGRAGVFVPVKAGGWLFVPGKSWSPSDPVFLPKGK